MRKKEHAELLDHTIDQLTDKIEEIIIKQSKTDIELDCILSYHKAVDHLTKFYQLRFYLNLLLICLLPIATVSGLLLLPSNPYYSKLSIFFLAVILLCAYIVLSFFERKNIQLNLLKIFRKDPLF